MQIKTLRKKVKWAIKHAAITKAERTYLETFLADHSTAPVSVIMKILRDHSR